MATEYITITKDGEFKCICLNTSRSSGFYPYTDGREVEPTPEEWNGRDYYCFDCGRVFNMNTGEVTGLHDFEDVYRYAGEDE